MEIYLLRCLTWYLHDMPYGDFKDLAKRAASDKVLKGKAFNIAINSKYGKYQRGLTSMLYKFFDTKAMNIFWKPRQWR